MANDHEPARRHFKGQRGGKTPAPSNSGWPKVINEIRLKMFDDEYGGGHDRERNPKNQLHGGSAPQDHVFGACGAQRALCVSRLSVPHRWPAAGHAHHPQKSWHHHLRRHLAARHAAPVCQPVVPCLPDCRLRIWRQPVRAGQHAGRVRPAVTVQGQHRAAPVRAGGGTCTCCPRTGSIRSRAWVFWR